MRIIDGPWVGYVYVCIGHAELVLTAEPGCTVEPVGTSVVAMTDTAPIRALVIEIRSTLLQARHDLDKVLAVPEAVRARDAVQRGLYYTAQCVAKLGGT